MQEIIKRLENAIGPDRTLDRSVIGVLVDAGEVESHPLLVDVPHYTESLDAALTLVPEGWRIDMMGERPDRTWDCRLIARCENNSLDVVRTSAALALCIAALRAREHVGAQS